MQTLLPQSWREFGCIIPVDIYVFFIMLLQKPQQPAPHNPEKAWQRSQQSQGIPGFAIIDG